MMKSISQNYALWTLVGVALTSAACSNVKLDKMVPVKVQNTKAAFCTTPPEGKNRYSKILFVVDKSGSNQNTDPNNEVRANSIQGFFDEHKQNEFYKWGYVAFGLRSGFGAGSRADSYINDGNGAGYFGTTAEMQQAINLQQSTPDDGETPYLAALSKAKDVIVNDLQNETDSTSLYNVFFISDGVPTDNGLGNQVTDDPNDPYIKLVKEVVGLAPGKVFLSTFFYDRTSNSRRAQDGLRYMAKAGGGKFFNLKNEPKIIFEEIKTGVVPESWKIKKMLSYNLNSAFCSDGSIDADSDADGLCDKDEVKFNKQFAQRLSELGKTFNPRQRNSVHEAYSDLFAYKFLVLPTGSGLEPCNLEQKDQDFDLLNSCEEAVLQDTQANGPTPQWTDEMRKLGGGTADPKNPDSDGDGIIDSIEFFQFGIKSAAVNFKNALDIHPGNITGSELMMQHRHPMRTEVFDEHNYDSKLEFTGLNEKGEYCYRFSQTQLALYETRSVNKDDMAGFDELAHGEGENTILIYYIITKEEDPNGKGIYFYTYKKANFYDGNNISLDLDMDGFQSYIIPKERR